ncbi:glycosyltransferase family 4 protein [Candidatus Shapirobacteria bacterium CG07_land_8_20_14_0_80_39_12]|uniref:Glycosyltransferase family 4 protein n=1 Tax=Candidatus Shapirobacteria bacterium CG07_land_8_20_14_0_80_39_12 TaxID=1974480 RepID=A0A2M6YPG8_9BACT|nr:MAG: glycosyltransferase family 4 protein [Candidatus Shapirobacteria bacterium CG07_land_8_20_14_0_80_39_12]
MKVALVYDRVNKIGGAERVLEVLHEIWPEAPLYTAVYYPPGAPWAKKFKVIPSFLNKWPLAKKHHELYPWLTPLAFESFAFGTEDYKSSTQRSGASFSDFDLVISITSAEAKGIITKPKTKHFCYCLTPTRYLWSGYSDYFFNKGLRWLAQPMVGWMRNWDKIAAQRPDEYLAISQEVQRRIKKYYHRESIVLYPPVDIEKFYPAEKNQNGDYFLIVSRLVSYKKIDLAVKAFNKLCLPLKIVGTGNQMFKLKTSAASNIEFLGELTDQELLSYYQDCRALIFPQKEDFGLVPLEAQSCGKPVIAFAGGGALETVIEGKTGTFFKPQSVKALMEKVKNFKDKAYQAADCRKNAEKFNKEIFKKKFKQLVYDRF